MRAYQLEVCLRLVHDSCGLVLHATISVVAAKVQVVMSGLVVGLMADQVVADGLVVARDHVGICIDKCRLLVNVVVLHNMFIF